MAADAGDGVELTGKRDKRGGRRQGLGRPPQRGQVLTVLPLTLDNRHVVTPVGTWAVMLALVAGELWLLVQGDRLAHLLARGFDAQALWVAFELVDVEVAWRRSDGAMFAGLIDLGVLQALWRLLLHPLYQPTTLQMVLMVWAVRVFGVLVEVQAGPLRVLTIGLTGAVVAALVEATLLARHPDVPLVGGGAFVAALVGALMATAPAAKARVLLLPLPMVVVVPVWVLVLPWLLLTWLAGRGANRIHGQEIMDLGWGGLLAGALTGALLAWRSRLQA